MTVNLKCLINVFKTVLIVNTILKLLDVVVVVNGEKPIRTPTLIKKQYTGCMAKDDFKSDDEDCTVFHRCAYGYQYTYVCPPNTGFDSAQKVCNFMMFVPECQELEGQEPSQIEGTSIIYPSGNLSNKQSNPNTSSAPQIEIIQVPIPTTKVCTLTLSQLERGIFCKSTTFKTYYGPCCV